MGGREGENKKMADQPLINNGSESGADRRALHGATGGVGGDRGVGEVLRRGEQGEYSCRTGGREWVLCPQREIYEIYGGGYARAKIILISEREGKVSRSLLASRPGI